MKNDEPLKETPPKKNKNKLKNGDRLLLSPNGNSNKFMNRIFKFDTQKLDYMNNSTDNNYSGKEKFNLALSSPRISPRSPLKTPPTPGVVVTSCRSSQKRSSITSAAIAFSAATAGAISPVASPKSSVSKFRYIILLYNWSEDLSLKLVCLVFNSQMVGFWICLAYPAIQIPILFHISQAEYETKPSDLWVHDHKF
jgi:hypothetical protein